MAGKKEKKAIEVENQGKPENKKENAHPTITYIRQDACEDRAAPPLDEIHGEWSSYHDDKENSHERGKQEGGLKSGS